MTKKTETPKKQIQFDPDACEALYEDLIEVFKKHQATTGEMIIAIGNTLYSIGASIEGYKEKGPDPETLQKAYYQNPSIGNALMVQGLTITSWYDAYQQQLLDITKKDS